MWVVLRVIRNVGSVHSDEDELLVGQGRDHARLGRRQTGVRSHFGFDVIAIEGARSSL